MQFLSWSSIVPTGQYALNGEIGFSRDPHVDTYIPKAAPGSNTPTGSAQTIEWCAEGKRRTWKH